jgi:hypothetical protein
VKFAIRDDDANFFTAPEQIERVYSDTWDLAPVSLAAVPRHAATRSGAIPREHWEGRGEFPIADNADLVSFLRAQQDEGHVSIVLHGYTHENFPAGFEFMAGPNLDQRLADGRAELQELFGRPIRTFVPPHNALGHRGLAAVDRAGLNVLGSFLWFNPRRRPWDRATLGNLVRVWRYRRKTGRGRHDRIVYPFPLRYSGHAEFGCHALIPGTTLDRLIAGFEEARRFGGDFCLATHYWELDETMLAALRGLLDHAQRAGARFVHADELFEAT